MQLRLSSPFKAGIAISEQAFFCSSCKKQVHDIRNLQSGEIDKLIRENKGDFCGIAHLEQVEFTHELSWKMFSRPVWKGVMASMMVYFQPNFSQAQAPVNPPPVEINAAGKCVNPVYRQSAIDSISEALTLIPNQNPVIKTQFYGIRLARIGKRTYCLNKRFPFFHSRRYRVMGAIRF
jgi:hypothetical protein